MLSSISNVVRDLDCIDKSVIESVVNEPNTIFRDLEVLPEEEDYDYEQLSWAEITDQEEELNNRSISKAKDEAGRKIFVGNVISNTGSSNTIAVVLLASIMSKFGKIECVRYHLASGYCFIVFTQVGSAHQAMKALKNYKVRCSKVNAITKECKVKNSNYLSDIPQPVFYCRWPRDKSRVRPTRKK